MSLAEPVQLQRAQSWRVERGDCVETMRGMPAESVDAIITDPPYGLAFMGKKWDDLGKGAEQHWHEQWAREALRVLKPGGHLLAFGGTRTYHRLTCGIEDAGFEVRDCLAWLYGSGFPKSHNIGKALDKAAGATREVVGTVRKLDSYGVANDVYGGGPDHHRIQAITTAATPEAERWEGWGTALKPAHEPIVLARKPLAGTVAANVLAHGTGGLNIDGCRVGMTERDRDRINNMGGFGRVEGHVENDVYGKYGPAPSAAHDAGRWPANVVLDDEAGAMLDEQTGDLAPGVRPGRRGADQARTAYGAFGGQDLGGSWQRLNGGGASRFFYCAKASTAERAAGLDGRNVHPTVKPINLMRWLVRLVAPPDGVVLDPFTGSGTTGCAAVLEGVRFVGIEREAEYADLADARIAHWADGAS